MVLRFSGQQEGISDLTSCHARSSLNSCKRSTSRIGDSIAIAADTIQVVIFELQVFCLRQFSMIFRIISRRRICIHWRKKKRASHNWIIGKNWIQLDTIGQNWIQLDGIVLFPKGSSFLHQRKGERKEHHIPRSQKVTRSL